MFQGGVWGVSEGQRILFAGLPLPTFFLEKREGAVKYGGLCVIQMNTVLFRKVLVMNLLFEKCVRVCVTYIFMKMHQEFSTHKNCSLFLIFLHPNTLAPEINRKVNCIISTSMVP